MKIQPLFDRVLFVRTETAKKTAGGIHVPDSAQEASGEGKVLAVGEGRVLENGTIRPLKVKAGDRILFDKYSGSEVELNGKKAIICREDSILAILSDD